MGDYNDDDFGKDGPPCVLTIRTGDVTKQYQYNFMYGNGPGSARLQITSPTLAPADTIIINSSELRGAGFSLKEVLPAELAVY